MKRVYIGVDGGGTKTLAVVIDQQGGELGRATTSCSNHNSVGPDIAKIAIDAAILQAISASNVTVSDVAGIVLGMSGADRKSDRDMITGWINEILPGVTCAIYNDAVTALASGTGGKLSGIVCICGTGTIAFGANDKGETARATGWGPLLGDEGSGYDIGIDVLRAVARAKDGIIPPTKLTEAIFAKLGVTAEEQLLEWAYSKENAGWQGIAALSFLAHQCAKLHKDEAAIAILKKAAAAMSAAIQTVIRRLDLAQPVPLVLAGGNLDHEGSILAEYLVDHITEAGVKVRARRPDVEPAIGAALLAKNLGPATSCGSG